MNQVKMNRLMDLIDDIKKVDAIIKTHSSNSSTFMIDQYLTKKEKLIGYLIDELLDPEVRSTESFSVIQTIIQTFYPNIKADVRIAAENSDFSKLESLLAS